MPYTDTHRRCCDECGVPLMVVRLPAVARSAAAARMQVRATLEAYGANPEQIDTVELLTSELVTNGILHAGALPGAELTVAVIREGGWVVVEVHDPSREFPQPGSLPDQMAEAGRGLFLVSTLAADHGVHLTEDTGKVVWFELLAWPADTISSAKGTP